MCACLCVDILDASRRFTRQLLCKNTVCVHQGFGLSLVLWHWSVERRLTGLWPFQGWNCLFRFISQTWFGRTRLRGRPKLGKKKRNKLHDFPSEVIPVLKESDAAKKTFHTRFTQRYFVHFIVDSTGQGLQAAKLRWWMTSRPCQCDEWFLSQVACQFALWEEVTTTIFQHQGQGSNLVILREQWETEKVRERHWEKDCLFRQKLEQHSAFPLEEEKTNICVCHWRWFSTFCHLHGKSYLLHNWRNLKILKRETGALERRRKKGAHFPSRRRKHWLFFNQSFTAPCLSYPPFQMHWKDNLGNWACNLSATALLWRLLLQTVTHICTGKFLWQNFMFASFAFSRAFCFYFFSSKESSTCPTSFIVSLLVRLRSLDALINGRVIKLALEGQWAMFHLLQTYWTVSGGQFVSMSILCPPILYAFPIEAVKEE